LLDMGVKKCLLVGAPVLAAGKFTTTRHRAGSGSENKFLSTFGGSKGPDSNYLNKVIVDGKDVFNLDNANSVEVGTCVEVEGVKSVKVCGVQFRALVYLKNGCQKEDSHIKEVKICDGTKAADSCVEVADSTGLDSEFFSNALAYEVLPCDPAVAAKEVDLSGHSSEDESEAAASADADVAEAELAAETAVAVSEPAPSPAPTMPPSPEPVAAEPEPTMIPTPAPPAPMPITPDPVPAEPVTAAPPAPSAGGPDLGEFKLMIGGAVVHAQNKVQQVHQNIVKQAEKVHAHVADVVKNFFKPLRFR